MKANLITFGSEKLREIHPFTMLALLEKLREENYSSASIKATETVSVDSLNKVTEIFLRAVKGEIQMGNNPTDLLYFKCSYGNDFSCCNVIFKKID